MKLAILSLCFLLVGFACAAPAYEQAVRNKAVNELAELQDFLSQLANMQQDEEEGTIQQDEEEPDQASIEELLTYLQQGGPEEQQEEPDQAVIEALMSYLQQEEPNERAMIEGWFTSLYRKAKKVFKSKGFRKWARHTFRWAKRGAFLYFG